MERRNTRQKELVLKAVKEVCCHPSAEDVYAVVHGWDERVSKATVYRDLKLLADEGLLRKIESRTSLQNTRYDGNLTPHSHGVCLSCGKLIDVRIPDAERLLDSVDAGKEDFVFYSHEVIFRGLCRTCRERR